MPAGEKITGEDGIIELTTGGTAEEIPCLTSYTLETSASLSEDTTNCMLSNADGGSSTDAAWSTSSVESRSWTLSSEHMWQEDDTVGASDQIDLTAVGETVGVKLYPHTSASGKVEYAGNAIIESVSVPAEVNGKITQSVTYKGTGALARNIVS